MTGSARNRVWYLLISAQNKATRLLPAFGQWRSRIGGQICRPFVLATSCVTSCYLRKERTNIRYRSAPTQNWRNTNKVEPGRSQRPNDTEDRYALLCFHCTQTHMKLWSEFSRAFKKNNFRPFAAPDKCRPVRPAPPRYATAFGSCLLCRVVLPGTVRGERASWLVECGRRFASTRWRWRRTAAGDRRPRTESCSGGQTCGPKDTSESWRRT